MISEETQIIINTIKNAVESAFKNMVCYVPTWIKMENNEIKVLTSTNGLDSQKIKKKVPRRYRRRLLKQGYIIYLGLLEGDLR